MIEELNLLSKRIIECVSLSISQDKIEAVENLFKRHISEFIQAVGDSKDKDLIVSRFKNLINKTLSTVEALGLIEPQYRAIRKLILSEMNGCLGYILKGEENK